MLDKATVYIVLAEGMYLLEKNPLNFSFFEFSLLSETVQIPVIFEISFSIPKLCTIF